MSLYRVIVIFDYNVSVKWANSLSSEDHSFCIESDAFDEDKLATISVIFLNLLSISLYIQ